jgi:uncharacterized protein YlzI (FlbEa/FlbD family)
MTEFIKLTKESGKSVHVNISKIESLERINDLTHVSTNTESYAVKEKPKEIKGLIDEASSMQTTENVFAFVMPFLSFIAIAWAIDKVQKAKKNNPENNSENTPTPENQAASHE